MLLKILINELVSEEKSKNGPSGDQVMKKLIGTDLEETICFYIAKRMECQANHFEKWNTSYNFELLLQIPKKGKKIKIEIIYF